MSNTTAFHGSTNSPTITSNAPPSVAPTSGMRSSTATSSASGTSGYGSGGGEDVSDQRSQFVPEIFDLVAEPLEEPTKPVLLGEPPDVLRRSLRGVGRGGDELDQT